MIGRLLLLCLSLHLLLPVRASADVITDWNNMLLQTFAQEGQNATPPANSRAMGMMGAAMFDAVNSVNRNFNAYLGYYDVTGPTSMEAAAAQAGYDVLMSLYGSNSFYASNFESLLNSQLAGITDSTARNNGIALGQSAAAAMITARTGDGSTASSTYTSQPINTPGAWQAGNSAGAWGATSGTFLKAEWGSVTPFTMNSGSQFRTLSPSGTSTWTQSDVNNFLASSAYTNALEEVRLIGSSTSATRTADQTNIAYFWMDGPGTASPPGHWNRIAQDLSGSLGIEDKARLFALLNLAEADVGIATWETKRYYDFWRPMQAIAQADIDGNAATTADTSWNPLIPTPSFPAFTSGHSAFSAAGAEILASFLGTDNVTFTSYSESPFLSGADSYRTFNSFSEAADEAGMSRIYGGIHYSFDNIEGQNLGENVASWTFSNFLQVVPEPSSFLLTALAGLILSFRRRR